MNRRHALLLLLLPLLSVSSSSEALDGGGIDTVFAVRKNTNGNRVDYGVRLDSQCRPRGDEPIVPYFRRTNDTTRELSFIERAVYGVPSQRVRTDPAGGGRVEFRLRAIPERNIRVVTRQADGQCIAGAITRVNGQDAVLTDVLVVLSNPRRVHHIEVTGRSVSDSSTLREDLHDD